MDVNTSKKSVLQIGNTIIWDVDLGEDENWQPEFHATVLYDGDDKPYRAAITRQWCEKYANKMDYTTLLQALKTYADEKKKLEAVRSYLAKVRKR